MEPSISVQLYSKYGSSVEIHIDAYIDKETGDLVLEGQDLGSGVNDLFGDTDYEYWAVVPATEKNKLLKSLAKETPEEKLKVLQKAKQPEDRLLLKLVQEHFHTDKAVSRFEKWCGKHGITCKFSNYI